MPSTLIFINLMPTTLRYYVICAYYAGVCNNLRPLRWIFILKIFFDIFQSFKINRYKGRFKASFAPTTLVVFQTKQISFLNSISTLIKMNRYRQFLKRIFMLFSQQYFELFFFCVFSDFWSNLEGRTIHFLSSAPF